ncbi:MAG: hypothetical protein V3W34_05140 [Phycisphaerae bacterium]
MTESRNALDALDRDFLGIRHELLNVAAALDRVDRGGDALRAPDDPRMARIGEAIKVLGESEAGRAERIQMVFSRAYDSNWR